MFIIVVVYQTCLVRLGEFITASPILTKELDISDIRQHHERICFLTPTNTNLVVYEY